MERVEWYAWIDQHLDMLSAGERKKRSPLLPLTLNEMWEEEDVETRTKFQMKWIGTSVEVTTMCDILLDLASHSVLAFDFEWHPSISSKIALAQLAASGVVYLIDVFNLDDAANMECVLKLLFWTP